MSANRLQLLPGEFAQIRRQSYLFVAALCLALISIGAAWWYLDQQQQAQMLARQALQQAQADAATMQQDRQDFDRYSQAYRQLLAKGVIGDEDRLQWVEVLTNISRQHPQMKLKYRIDAQRPLDFVPDVPDGMRVFASRMHLRLLTAHEAQLLAVLEQLDKEAHGLHLLRQCEIRRGKLDEQQRDWVAPPLESQCLIEWVTLRQSSQTPASADAATAGSNP